MTSCNKLKKIFYISLIKLKKCFFISVHQNNLNIFNYNEFVLKKSLIKWWLTENLYPLNINNKNNSSFNKIKKFLKEKYFTHELKW